MALIIASFNVFGFTLGSPISENIAFSNPDGGSLTCIKCQFEYIRCTKQQKPKTNATLARKFGNLSLKNERWAEQWPDGRG